MEIKKTERGFSYVEFTDRNDVECNLQESSLATEAAIWLGAEDIELKRFKAVEEHHVANNRMHLTQEHVAKLIPILQYFVDNGYLPSGDEGEVE